MKHLFSLVSLMLGICFFGCQDENLSEYYGNLLTSPSGLVLEQSEHPDGWGHSDCQTCHNPSNFHRDRSDRASGIDMSVIRSFVETEGSTSCSTCHGTNGGGTQ